MPGSGAIACETCSSSFWLPYSPIALCTRPAMSSGLPEVQTTTRIVSSSAVSHARFVTLRRDPLACQYRQSPGPCSAHRGQETGLSTQGPSDPRVARRTLLRRAFPLSLVLRPPRHSRLGPAWPSVLGLLRNVRPPASDEPATSAGASRSAGSRTQAATGTPAPRPSAPRHASAVTTTRARSGPSAAPGAASSGNAGATTPHTT